MTIRTDDLKNKQFIKIDEFISSVPKLLEKIQAKLFENAQKRLFENIYKVNKLDELDNLFTKNSPSPFVLCYWDDKAMDHELIKKHKLTPRCVPYDEEKVCDNNDHGTCLFTGTKNSRRVILAKSY